MYLEMAEEEDEKLAESWQADPHICASLPSGSVPHTHSSYVICRPTQAWIWMFDGLDEDHELECFFSSSPGFHNSKSGQRTSAWSR